MWWKIFLVLLGVFVVAGWVYGYFYVLVKEREWACLVSDLPPWLVKLQIVIIAGPLTIGRKLFLDPKGLYREIFGK